MNNNNNDNNNDEMFARHDDERQSLKHRPFDDKSYADTRPTSYGDYKRLVDEADFSNDAIGFVRYVMAFVLIGWFITLTPGITIKCLFYFNQNVPSNVIEENPELFYSLLVLSIAGLIGTMCGFMCCSSPSRDSNNLNIGFWISFNISAALLMVVICMQKELVAVLLAFGVVFVLTLIITLVIVACKDKAEAMAKYSSVVLFVLFLVIFCIFLAQAIVNVIWFKYNTESTVISSILSFFLVGFYIVAIFFDIAWMVSLANTFDRKQLSPFYHIVSLQIDTFLLFLQLLGLSSD